MVVRGLGGLKESSFRQESEAKTGLRCARGEAGRQEIRLMAQKTGSRNWLAGERRQRSQQVQRDGGAGRVHGRAAGVGQQEGGRAV